MAIIGKKMAGQPAPEETSEAPEGQTPPSEMDGQTPPSQIDLEKFMYVVEAAVTDKKTGLMEKISDAITAAKDLPGALASAAYDLVAAIDEKTGGQLPDEDLASAAAETLGLIAEVAEASGKQITGREISAATKAMLSRFMEENGDAEGQAALEQQDAESVGAQLDQPGQEVA